MLGKKKIKGTPSLLPLLFEESHTANKKGKRLREKSASFTDLRFASSRQHHNATVFVNLTQTSIHLGDRLSID